MCVHTSQDWYKLEESQNTAKERISEDVVGIVVFASESSRSMAIDPIWTPCDRSYCGTCQIQPTHLAKLHAPGKTWKTPIEELHTRAWAAWHTELLRECTQASRVPLGQSEKDLNKLQRYLSHHSTVNAAKLEFHPNIKLRHVYKTIVFSDQSVSWHRLKEICKCVILTQLLLL